MDDDGPKAPKAGRRAGRNVGNWGEEPSGPPEPQKGGFGLDAGFGGSSAASPAPKASGFMGDDGRLGSAGGAGTLQQLNDDSPPPSRSRTGDVNLPVAKSTGGDDDENRKKFGGVSRRKAEQLTRGDDEVSRKNLKYESLTAGVDGIMEIPELEEEGREDLSTVVAEAPKVRINKVQGMDELEEDMHFKLPAMDDRDIDLSLLTAVLCSSEQVQEAEETWDPDIILTEVASAINAEREKAEGVDAVDEAAKDDMVK
ncbi:hypothetical protein GPECTOR_22g947 [Gonium pectorale]|uniref:Intraflagellar transport protein 43 n=1 Tax=Gonium pectorale TaxID=33097 RepID=A0A150GHU3_GONPE|nr:hypothetical protein GPECTOR_22g947 [Gonium pectorale]|eukprot:KXZ49353.1 hypothetical protein GPECTOR_22g947 [Gonium pectorale]